MGRSQVLRNRARGRPGQGRGGRGAGRGRSDTGGGRSSSRHKGGADPRKLGDNAFRFQRSTSSTSAGGNDYDGLLDDINFMPTGGGLGEYYGDSHYAANKEEEDLADATLSAATEALASSEKEKMNRQQNDEVVENWMSIDIKALDKCMKQISIHERLKVPRHIGKHLENMYGVDGGGGGRKKTLAELREESKCMIVEEESRQVASSQPQSDKEEVQAKQSDSAKIQHDKMNNIDDASDGNADDEEEDLDAWLDDMIA
ncbi:hypothetical protein ACHAXR_010819 [Thalassiosira sp. AJA248-18]